MHTAERSCQLVELLPPGIDLLGEQDVVISGINTDSRRISAGDLFVAKTGFNQRGSAYIRNARDNGAVAVVTDDEGLSWQEGDLPTAFVPQLEQNVSKMASRFFGYPSQQVSVVGITGTNGKTSCCYWYAWLSNYLGRPCGEIGTLGAGLKKKETDLLEPTGFTTPEAAAVQSLLASISDAGAQAVVMEVSSHGLDQGRVEAVQFETAIFTNLSQDHLDYHGDMRAYLYAKAKLFKYLGLKNAILNLDDEHYGELAASVDEGAQILSYSLSSKAADLHVTAIEWDEQGARVELDGRWGSVVINVPVVGHYNLANILAVMAALLASGFELSDLSHAVEKLPPVPGRMQVVGIEAARSLPTVIVDYAHTPDAITNVLTAVRPQVSGRLVAVAGCGGDRDHEKRPAMGAALSRLADESWFTSDNPRSEDPQSIVNDMVGDLRADEIRIELDRAAAISGAIQSAAELDLVMILGKGHETYQDVQGIRYPFDDVEVAKAVLSEMASIGVQR